MAKECIPRHYFIPSHALLFNSKIKYSAPVMNSKLVFGTGGRFGRLAPGLAQSLVDTAIESGITKFDTGLFYCGGKSQQLLFACLSDHISRSPSSFEISTKFPPGHSYAIMNEWLNGSISQLGVRGYLDALFVWGPSLEDLYDSSLISSLVSFRSSGRIKSIGVNTHDCDVMKALVGSPLGLIVDCVMIDFSLLQQDRIPIISLFSEAGISVWAGTALCQGFLSQSLLRMVWRTRSLSYFARALCSKPTKVLRAKASKVRPVLAQIYPDTFEAIPLSYVLSREDICRVPVGMLSRSSIQKNVAIEVHPLEKQDLDLAADVAQRLCLSGFPGHK